MIPSYLQRFREKFTPEWWGGFGTTEEINNLGIAGIEGFITQERQQLIQELTPDWKEVARFFSRTKLYTNGCWNWTGAAGTNKYGHFVSKNRGNMLAHRFAYELMVGEIPEGMFVCHKCDNPKCICPDHLFVGTHADNMKDARDKGRTATGTRNGKYTVPSSRLSGEKNGMAKLSDAQVAEIKAAYIPKKVTFKAVADRYGISESHVHAIVSGRKRRDVESPY